MRYRYRYFRVVRDGRTEFSSSSIPPMGSLSPKLEEKTPLRSVLGGTGPVVPAKGEAQKRARGIEGGDEKKKGGRRNPSLHPYLGSRSGPRASDLGPRSGPRP